MFAMSYLLQNQKGTAASQKHYNTQNTCPEKPQLYSAESPNTVAVHLLSDEYHAITDSSQFSLPQRSRRCNWGAVTVLSLASASDVGITVHSGAIQVILSFGFIHESLALHVP